MIRSSSVMLTLVLVALLLNSITSVHSQVSTSSKLSSKNDILEWIDWAKTAWSYFDPGTGVDPNTGIPRASYHWSFLTDWDLGGYIIAIIKLELMGILPKEGEWGADYRIEKVLRFLETRPLSPYNIPYHIYSSTTGDAKGKGVTNVSDSGRLLIALALLKKYRPDLAKRIDAIVRRNNYAYFVNRTDAWRTTAGFYKYYIVQGFRLFGLDNGYPVQKALREFDNIVNGPHIEIYGVSIPKTEVTSEPLLHMVFEFDVDEKYMDYVRRVYEVQERRYRATGKYTAWSEGNTGLQDVTYVYEWIATPGGEAWKITPKSITPIIFTKAAFGFHALFDTDYTRELVTYLISKNEERKNKLPYVLFLPNKGFIEGVDEGGRIVAELVDKTQIIIIEAAYYVLKKQALESADLLLEYPSSEIMPGEPIEFKFTYDDPTPLRHSCRYNVTISGLSTAYSVQHIFNNTCNVTFSWTPPSDGIYYVVVEVYADYVLFNKSITKSFDIKVGIPPVREARVMDVNYPYQVSPGEVFNISALVWYNFSVGQSPLTIMVRDRLGNNIVAEADPVNVTGGGMKVFTVAMEAPNREGNLTLVVIPAYYNGSDWMELSNGAAEITVSVARLQQMQSLTVRTIVKKEVSYVTVTHFSTVERRLVTTYTITEKLVEREGDVLMPVAVIVCSLCLLVIAILTVVFRWRGLARSEYRFEELGW